MIAEPSWRACASRASIRSRMSSRASRPSRTSTPPTTRSRPGEETDQEYRIAGRMTARRGHGGAAFLDIVDRSGKLQVHAKSGCPRC